ncbi:MAG: hypothetical protein VW378_03125 [bacterium]
MLDNKDVNHLRSSSPILIKNFAPRCKSGVSLTRKQIHLMMVLDLSKNVLRIEEIPRPLMRSLTKELELVENIFKCDDGTFASLSQSQYEQLNIPVSMISTPTRSNILKVGDLRLKLTVNQQGVLQKVEVFHKDYQTTVAGKPVNSEHENYSKEFVVKDGNNIIVKTSA